MCAHEEKVLKQEAFWWHPPSFISSDFGHMTPPLSCMCQLTVRGCWRRRGGCACLCHGWGWGIWIWSGVLPRRLSDVPFNLCVCCTWFRLMFLVFAYFITMLHLKIIAINRGGCILVRSRFHKHHENDQEKGGLLFLLPHIGEHGYWGICSGNTGSEEHTFEVLRNIGTGEQRYCGLQVTQKIDSIPADGPKHAVPNMCLVAVSKKIMFTCIAAIIILCCWLNLYIVVLPCQASSSWSRSRKRCARFRSNTGTESRDRSEIAPYQNGCRHRTQRNSTTRKWVWGLAWIVCLLGVFSPIFLYKGVAG